MKRTILFVLILLYITLTFYLSGKTFSSFPNIGIKRSDLLFHFIEYAFLAGLIISYFTVTNRDISWRIAAFYTILICTVVGALNEFYQSTVPFRTPSVSDGLANLFGAVVVVIILRGYYRSKLNSRRAYGARS